MATIKVKELFFDRAAVIKAVGRAAARNLARSGALLMRIARNSMRYSKKSAPPGQPPRAHKPNPLLRKLLFFSFDPGTESVVVGPERIGKGVAPALMEYGGEETVLNTRRRLRKVGDGGEIRTSAAAVGRDAAGRFVAMANGATSKVVKDTLLGKRVVVTYTKLRTQAEADRSNQIQERLYGPMRVRSQIAARPYMGPALEKARPSLTQLWANSVR